MYRPLGIEQKVVYLANTAVGEPSEEQKALANFIPSSAVVSIELKNDAFHNMRVKNVSFRPVDPFELVQPTGERERERSCVYLYMCERNREKGK